METKCKAETEEKVIQRLSHLGIHPIYSQKTQTLLWMPKSACWQEPSIAVSWDALPEPYKYRGRCWSQPLNLVQGPQKGGREKTEGAEGVCSPIEGTDSYWTNQYPPELPGTKPPTKEYTWRDPWLQPHMWQRMAWLDISARRGPWAWGFSMPHCREMPGWEGGSGSTLIEAGEGG